MTTKTTGAEFNAFYTDEEIWKDRWHEDETIVIDGDEIDGLEWIHESIAPESRVEISGGVINTEDGRELGSFEGYFRKWRKNQNTAIIVARVPKDKIAEVRAWIREAGGRVI